MTDAIPHAPSRKNLLLHPLTHAVYALDDDTVFESVNGPPSSGSRYIDMSLDDFEKMVHTGPCSAERLVEFSKLRNGGFHYAQLVFLKLRGHADGYAWASRIRVHADWTVPEIKDRVFGQAFLWVWPTSAAINAFVCYQEHNNLTMVPNETLERFAPATRHEPSLPGAQIGPDDFEGAVQVPHDKLTAAQRLLIACIRPQRTQFQRRRRTDRWPAAMWEIKYQRDIGTGDVNAAASIVATHFKPTQFRKRSSTPTSMSTIAHLDRLGQVTYAGFDLLQLPSEIVTRLVGATAAVAMTKSTHETAKMVCALRRASKHIRALTDGFLGLTLAQLTHTVGELVSTGTAKTDVMLHVGNDVRALGITPLLVLKLRAMGGIALREEVVQLYPLLQSIRTVPRWQWYLRLRARLDQSVAAEARPVRITKRPSRVHKHVCTVNGVETFVHVPEFDELITSGSASPSVVAMQMMERVGV